MPNTFGGEHRSPRRDGRGHSQAQLQRRASFDNEPSDDCLSSLFLLSILATTAVAAIRKGRA